MRRAPIVIAATVAGVAALLSYHTGTTTVDIASLQQGGPAKAGSAGSTGSAGPRYRDGTVTGPAVFYSYGTLSIAATVSNGRITKVSVASLADTEYPQSVQIDEQSLPVLERQAISADGADIAGVSGATFTTQGFTQSLQGALAKLKR